MCCHIFSKYYHVRYQHNVSKNVLFIQRTLFESNFIMLKATTKLTWLAVRVKLQSMHCLKMTSLGTYIHAFPLTVYMSSPVKTPIKACCQSAVVTQYCPRGRGHVTLTTTFPPRKDILPNRHVHTPTWKKRLSPCGNSPHPDFKDIAAQTRHSTAMAVCVITHKGILRPLIIAVAWSVT